jgi:alpha-galactosidase
MIAHASPATIVAEPDNMKANPLIELIAMDRFPSPAHNSRRRSIILAIPLLAFLCVLALPGHAAPATPQLAPLPPMGWNDWAHYQCGFTAQTILANAKSLVKTGLAARGYDTVTIDDCWMQKDRDAHGDLQVDPKRFPQGMKPIADAVHALGLKFGIYEDSGYLTCGGFAGSGTPKGGGKDYFLQDAKLFASWGVDYLKLDGCNLYVPKGGSTAAVYRTAYAAQNAALKVVNRPIVFSESAPAYFQNTPDWYDVLTWVRDYGQLWREGTDIDTFDEKKPGTSRFRSVLWNYAYNLPLGRFQKPGNWNDSDFIIGGDSGLSVAETRSQMALWAMMSAPLILSSDLDKLTPQSVAILGNKAVIAVDQDKLGKMATLVRRTPAIDILLKPLSGGDFAIAVLNHGAATTPVELHPADLGFTSDATCHLDTQNLWSGDHQSSAATLHADVASHDTAIWRVHAASSCGTPTRTGTITMIAIRKRENIDGYTSCLSAQGRVEPCAGTPPQTWTFTADGALKSGAGGSKSTQQCLAVSNGKPAMQACSAASSQHWNYTLVGNLVSAEGNKCLSSAGPAGQPQSLSLQACGHNQPNQIWSLPN